MKAGANEDGRKSDGWGLWGGWRRNGLEDGVRKEGSPVPSPETVAVFARLQNEGTGVRAPIVAKKRGNSRGAKGCRKVDCGRSR